MNAFKKAVAAAGILVLGALAFLVPRALRAERETETVVESFYSDYNKRDFKGPDAAALERQYAKLGALGGKTRESAKLLALSGRRFYWRFRSRYAGGESVDSFVLASSAGAWSIESYSSSAMCPPAK